jgi:hypothetical protein
MIATPLHDLMTLGHFNNPDEADAFDFDKSQIDRLGREDKPAISAARSFQHFHAQRLDQLTHVFHGRGCRIDGDIGPATLALLAQPRCQLPDYASKSAEANWPNSCRDNITVRSQWSGLGSPHVDTVEAFTAALNSWEKVLSLDFHQVNWSHGEQRINAEPARLPGSVLAWSHLATGSCSANLQQRYDSTQRWSAWLFQSVAAHELGHALGLGHIRNSNALMYPSITDVLEPAELDIREAVRLGYKLADPDEPEDPPVNPDIWSIFIKALLAAIVAALDDKGAPATKGCLMDGSRLQKLRHIRAIRRGVKRGQWRKHREEIVAQIMKPVTEDEAVELIELAKLDR